jgi:hypothetical protein
MQENNVPVVSMDPAMDIVNNKISFRVSQVVKDAKNKGAKNVIKKKTRKEK